jgi:hypothetical protein
VGGDETDGVFLLDIQADPVAGVEKRLGRQVVGRADEVEVRFPEKAGVEEVELGGDRAAPQQVDVVAVPAAGLTSRPFTESLFPWTSTSRKPTFRRKTSTVAPPAMTRASSV